VQQRDICVSAVTTQLHPLLPVYELGFREQATTNTERLHLLGSNAPAVFTVNELYPEDKQNIF
jgi:hypothetical protein